MKFRMKEVEGRKLQMSQVFAEDGRVTPVTLIKLRELPEDLVPGVAIRVTAISKGKGFAGVVKRWGFAGGPATHGQSDRQRHPGSIGERTTPGRVYRGKKMAGHMGREQITVRGLSVVETDSERQVVKISGAIPGPRRGKVILRYEPGEANSPAKDGRAGDSPDVGESELRREDRGVEAASSEEKKENKPAGKPEGGEQKTTD